MLSVVSGIMVSSCFSASPTLASSSFCFFRGSAMITPMANEKKMEAKTPTHAATHSWPVAEMTTPPSSPPPEPPKSMNVPMIG